MKEKIKAPHSKTLMSTMRLFATVLMLTMSGNLFSQSSAIQGKLQEAGAPVSGAEVVLQSFKDEACAKLFAKKKPKQAELERLNQCAPDVKTVCRRWR